MTKHQNVFVYDRRIAPLVHQVGSFKLSFDITVPCFSFFASFSGCAKQGFLRRDFLHFCTKKAYLHQLVVVPFLLRKFQTFVVFIKDHYGIKMSA